MIDWGRVAELRSEIGDDDFREVVDLFLDEVQGVLQRLAEAPEPVRFEDDFHFLKGSAWNLGFSTFGEMCQSAERRASAGRAEGIDIAAIHECYRVSKQAFQAGVGTAGPAAA